MAEGDINLAALWVPVMAETSHIKEQLKKAGEEGKASFLEGIGMAEVGSKMGSGILDGLKNSELSGGMATILAGGFAGVTAAFVEGGLNLINTTFEKTIDLAKEAAKSVLEIGESWHEVSRQLELSTTASGEKLEELNRSAQNVVRSGLDTSMNNLGNTMGVLSQRIGMTGQPLEDLTKNLLRVQDRFGEFKAGDFAAILKQFDVGPEGASKALESLVNASRATSVALPQIIAGAKDTGSVFHQLGLDAGEAGALVAQLNAAGINTAPVLKALQASAKKLPPGESLADEIKGIIEQLDKAIQTGDVHQEQSLAAKLFGPKWADALTAIQKGLLDTSTLIATFSNDGGENLDQLLEHSATLGNKWQELKNDAAEALKPLGEAAIKLIEGPLEQLKGWFNQNHGAIVAKVKEFGDKFIENLPAIRDFVASATEMLGQWFNFVKSGLVVVGEAMGQILWAWGKLSFNDDLAKRASDMIDSLDKLDKIDFGQGANKVSDWIRGMNIDVPQLKQNFDELSDSMSGVGSSSLGSGLSGLTGTRSASGASTGSNGQTYNVVPQAFTQPAPGSSSKDQVAATIIAAARARGLNQEQTLAALSVGLLETGLGANPSTNTPQNQNGTVVQGVFQQDSGYDKYGGRTNPADAAAGFVDQFIARGGLNMDPYDAAVKVQVGKYGPDYVRSFRSRALDYYNRLAGAGQGPGSSYPFDHNLVADSPAFGGPPSPSPGGSTDDALSWLLQPLLPQSPSTPAPSGSTAAGISAMQGGSVTYTPDWLLQHGIQPIFNKNPNDPGGAASPGEIPQWVYQLGAQYGLTPKDHGDVTLHGGIRGPGNTINPQASWAFDFFGDPANMQKFADDLKTNDISQIIQLIHQDPTTGRQTGIAGGQDVSGTYYGSTYGEESDEVHVAFASPIGPGAGTNLGWGHFPAGGAAPPASGWRPLSQFDNATAPGGGGPSDNVAFSVPGLSPPQLTGNYQIDSRNLQLFQAQEAIVNKQADIAKQWEKITEMENDPTADPAKLQAAKDKARSDETQLGVDKERLQLDREKPYGRGSSSSGLESDAEKFGSGFLKGIFSDLGFGNVLGGKSPLDWGIVKLLGGLAGWGIGEANQWADNQMAGGQGGLGALGGGSPVGGGILQGVLRDVMPNGLARAAVPLGPSQVSGVPTPALSGQHQGTGAAPGPAPGAQGPSFTVNQFGVDNGPTSFGEFYNSMTGNPSTVYGSSSGMNGTLPIAPGG